MNRNMFKKFFRYHAPVYLQMFGSHISRKEGRAIFDAKFYQENCPDLAGASYDPFVHFLRFGFAEGRPPNGRISTDYVYNSHEQSALVGQNLNEAYLSSGLLHKPRLLFVSHDATRTGAPAILLRLLQIFSESRAFECFTILDQGGDRLPEFEAVSHVHVMSRFRYDKDFSDKEALAELASFLDKKGVFEGNRPVCAIVNSVESFRIGQNLAALGIPVVSLIHEIASFYPPAIFQAFSRFSKSLIFPSQFVKKAAVQHCKQDLPNVYVRGQGLLQDDFGRLDREQCRKMLREELEVEDDAFIVLNVGSKDIRKGADMFVKLAAIIKNRGQKKRPIYFVWYGGADKNFSYAEVFVKQHGLEDSIRLMPLTPEIERIFMGSDVFLLTARADPFPCVVHEAMASGLPVIAFENGGGAPELIGDDCGIVVGMGDLAKAADAIENYLDLPEIHQEQAQNAREKIAKDWRFSDYHVDIYNFVKQAAAPPAGGWPAISPSKASAHLVISHGAAGDLSLIQSTVETMGETEFEVALIGGRFCSGIDETVEGLKRLGYPYKVHQPTTDTDDARAMIVDRLLKYPRPQRVAFLDTLRFVSPDQLKILNFPVTATLTSESVSTQDLYRMLLHLDTLHLSNETTHNKLREMNPDFAEKIDLIIPLKVTGSDFIND